VSDLVVRVYNVRFGDAVLVAIPEMAGGHQVTRTVLFDFGNALGTAGGEDDVFAPVIDDIIARLAGKPLDLYVMTHEHLDHVQGLFHAAEKLNKRINVKQAWLTGSADPGYYDTHQDARKQKIAALTAYRAVRSRLGAAANRSPFVDILLANNDTSKTSKCVQFLREELTQPGDVHYVDRTSDLSGLQPSTAAQVTLWAPEENTADYYGAFKPLAAALRIGREVRVEDIDPDAPPVALSEAARPPSGVDAGAFYNLIDVRHENSASTLLSIDHASNNTSIVLLLEWKGWKLLFSGDAEKRSWRTMNKKGLIQPVHFLKVSHHGSHTGMPPIEILDKLLPMPPPGGQRRAAVSTFLHTYPGVPNQDTLDELARRTDLKSTLDLAAGELFLEFSFSSAGP
jgi:hypothetical protein